MHHHHFPNRARLLTCHRGGTAPSFTVLLGSGELQTILRAVWSNDVGTLDRLRAPPVARPTWTVHRVHSCKAQCDKTV
jgi:hypothetical protein